MINSSTKRIRKFNLMGGYIVLTIVALFGSCKNERNLYNKDLKDFHIYRSQIKLGDNKEWGKYYDYLMFYNDSELCMFSIPKNVAIDSALLSNKCMTTFPITYIGDSTEMEVTEKISKNRIDQYFIKIVDEKSIDVIKTIADSNQRIIFLEENAFFSIKN